MGAAWTPQNRLVNSRSNDTIKNTAGTQGRGLLRAVYPEDFTAHNALSKNAYDGCAHPQHVIELIDCQSD